MMFGPVFNLFIQFFLLYGGGGTHIQPILELNPSTFKASKVIANATPDSLKKYVYLSFDDGPLPGTSNCIAVCKSQQVAATFFEVGLHQSRNNYGKNLFNRIVSDSLFMVANHSFTHAFYGDYVNYYHQAGAALQDFLKAKQVLAVSNNITRLPGNNAWNTQTQKRASGLVKPLVTKLDSVGFNVIGWDLEWHFNKFGKPVNSPESIAALADSLLIKNKTKNKNHLVILMHDHMFRSTQDSIKLTRMISLLKQHPDIQFRKLSSYPGLKPAFN
jgi:peptidoglycan/xylan/chitin deacetylase (PgdA/CDA1 family)